MTAPGTASDAMATMARIDFVSLLFFIFFSIAPCYFSSCSLFNYFKIIKSKTFVPVGFFWSKVSEVNEGV